MTAYNFQLRFAHDIAMGYKLQTIRKHRRPPSRHANAGETLQLYTGMRTPGCMKLAEGTCCATWPIRMSVGRRGITRITIAGRDHPEGRWDDFAKRDGFSSIENMSAFWLDMHGPGEFEGVLIRWTLDR